MLGFGLFIARVALGSGLILLGLRDFRKSQIPQTHPTEPGSSILDWISSLDALVFDQLPEKAVVRFKQLSALFILFIGLWICIHSFGVG